MTFSCSSASAERSPCFHALQLPLGAPGLVPPCIRHRRLPLTAGDRHSAPDRVFAPQRGALARFSGCMGLFVKSSNRPVPSLVQGYQKAAGSTFPAPSEIAATSATPQQWLKSLGFQPSSSATCKSVPPHGGNAVLSATQKATVLSRLS